MKESGEIIKRKEKELNIIKMEKQEKVFGKMTNFFLIDYFFILYLFWKINQ